MSSKSIIIPVDNTSNDKILSIISNLPNSIKKPACYAMVLARITSFFNKSEESLKYLPETSYFTNDYNTPNTYKHSKSMSISSIIYGRYSNLYTATAIPFQKTDKKDFKKYIFDSRDLTFKNGMFTYPKIIYNNDINIRISNQNDVFINNTLYENCSDEQRKEALDMIYICQSVQHAQTHYFGTYGYNLLMSSKVDTSSPLLSLIMSYGKDLRDESEGFAFPALFLYNTLSLTQENVIRTLEFMSSSNHILFQNLLEHDILQLETTISIYKIFKEVVLCNLSLNDIQQISEKCNLDNDQVKYFIVNMMFFMTFFHAWTHQILENSEQDYYITSGQLNQYSYGINTQKDTNNSLIKELRDNIEKKYPGFGKYVINIHQM